MRIKGMGGHYKFGPNPDRWELKCIPLLRVFGFLISIIYYLRLYFISLNCQLFVVIFVITKKGIFMDSSTYYVSEIYQIYILVIIIFSNIYRRESIHVDVWGSWRLNQCTGCHLLVILSSHVVRQDVYTLSVNVL